MGPNPHPTLLTSRPIIFLFLRFIHTKYPMHNTDPTSIPTLNATSTLVPSTYLGAALKLPSNHVDKSPPGARHHKPDSDCRRTTNVWCRIGSIPGPQCWSGGVHTRYGQEETTIPGGCRRRGEKHDESYQGHDGGNDTDKASDRVLVTKVGGRHREHKGRQQMAAHS